MSHPLELFRYCPRCGSEHFVVNDARSRRCEKCGFVYYANAAAATVAVIRNSKGELLVTRRAYEPARGTLDLPGGFIDPGEDAVAGVLREVLEETGAKAEFSRFLFSLPNEYVFSNFTVHTCDLFFELKISDETAVFAHDDAAELLWIPFDKINPAHFGLHSIRRGVERLLSQAEKG